MRLVAVLQALFVTFLWSTSFIIIKWGLSEIPPVTFAGLRYGLAWACLIPFVLQAKPRNEIHHLTKLQWRKLVLVGIVFYTITQGAQFVGLSLLPAVTVSIVLNFTPLIVAFMGIRLLDEVPRPLQWTGALLFIMGILVYFYPVSFAGTRGLGLAVMAAAVMANSWAAVLGREINREHNLSPLVITFVSMGVGSTVLLASGFTTEGFPVLNATNIAIIVWLAAVNTAFAFTLWNLTLRSLTAMESSIINGTMLIQIAILAWFFLDEKVTIQEGFGMIAAAAGAVLVQIRKKNWLRVGC